MRVYLQITVFFVTAHDHKVFRIGICFYLSAAETVFHLRQVKQKYSCTRTDSRIGNGFVMGCYLYRRNVPECVVAKTLYVLVNRIGQQGCAVLEGFFSDDRHTRGHHRFQ